MKPMPNISLLLLLAAGLAFGTSVSVQAQDAARTQESLTFISWGGAYTRSQMLAFVRPYEALTGARIDVLDYTGGLEEIRRQVRSLNIRWDVVDLESSDAIRACEEGLLERIDPSELEPAPDGIPVADDFLEGGLTSCAIGTVVWSTVIAYDERVVGTAPPQRLQDFFDLRRYPGKRGLRRTPKANLEWALLVDGVAQDRLYEVLESEAGLQRAFRVLDRIKPHLVWWTDGEEAVRLLETGQVTMTSAYNGRIHRAVEARGEPFGIIWDHQVWNIDLLGIPAGHPRPEQPLAFIRFATAAPQLAEQSRHIPYGPVRRSAFADIAPEIVPHLPTSADKRATALQIDARWWAEHYDHVNRRFEAWLDRPVQVPRDLPR